MYSSAVFTGGRRFCTQFSPGQGRPPSTILSIRKLETLSYPKDEDRNPQRSLVLTEYWSVTDRQTGDGRTVRFALAYTAFAKLALLRAVKMTGIVNANNHNTNGVDDLVNTGAK